MSSYVRFLGVILTLGGAAVLAVPPDADTVKSIEKQADEVGKKDWNDLAKQGEAIAKKHDIGKVMQMMKRRNPGSEDPEGVGVGKTPGAIKPDGIEIKIINLKGKLMPPDQLDKEQADLIRMAEIAAAIASVSRHQNAVEKKMGDKDPAKWNEWMEQMHKESQNLIKGLKDKKPEAIRDAAKSLHKSCVECHTTFRDVP